MVGAYFSLSLTEFNLCTACVMPKYLCDLKLTLVSPQVWESEMCKDNTVGTVQEILLCVDCKYNLFVKEDLEKEKEWGNGEHREILKKVKVVLVPGS